MRVIIAEDQALLARRAGAAVHRQGPVVVVAALGSTDGLAEAVAQTTPTSSCSTSACHRRTPTKGRHAARLLKAEMPNLGVLLLSQHIETANTADLVAWPGFGYLLKDRVSKSTSSSRRRSGWRPRRLSTRPQSRGGDGGQGRGTGTDRPAVLPRTRRASTHGRRAHQRRYRRPALVSPRTIEAHVSHLLTKLDIEESDTATDASSLS